MNLQSASGDSIKGVGGEALLSVGLLECLMTEFRSELESPGLRPIREENEQVAQISPGFNTMEPARGDQRSENAIPIAAVLAAQEEPVFPADHLGAQGELAEVPTLTAKLVLAL